MSKSIEIISKTSIFTAIRPLILVLQVTGFANFSINPKTFEANVKFFNILTTIFIISVNLLLHYIFWFSYFDFDIQGTEIAKTAIPKLVYACIIVHSLVKVLNFLNRHKIAKFLSKVHKIDEKFEALKIHFDYKIQKSKINQTLSLVCILAIVMSTLGFCIQTSFSNGIDMSISLFHLYGNVSGFLISYQIVVVMLAIKNKFEAINKFLTSKTVTKISDLQILAEIHFMTTKLIEMFNEIFGLAMMMSMALVFSWHCITLFMTIMMSSVMWTKHLFVTLFHMPKVYHKV